MKNEFKVISDLIEDNKKVLDVGCADGTLMQFLKEHKNINVRGLEISANHVRSAKKGHVYATANPIHIGKKTHLWEIKVIDDESNLISHCKLTTIVVDKK